MTINFGFATRPIERWSMAATVIAALAIGGAGVAAASASIIDNHSACPVAGSCGVGPVLCGGLSNGGSFYWAADTDNPNLCWRIDQTMAG